MSKRIVGIILAFFGMVLAVIAAVFGIDLGGGDGANGSLPYISLSDQQEVEDWYDIYFTNPSCPPEEERVGGLDETIAADLATAEVRVDVAAFELDSETLADALIALEARGVPVRVVTDEDFGEERSVRRLRRGGISVVEDDRRALMHNKFIVIDGRITYTGSMNFSSNGIYCNNNNLVRIDSPRLAANYIAEMDEMYNDRSFGPTSPINTPNEQLT